MKKTTELKAFALSLMMVAMMLPMTMFAQKNDNFVTGFNNGVRDADPITIWTANNGFQNDDFGAPLGSGLLILTAVGAGYAISRRKRNIKKGTTLLLAALMLIGMTACKKKVAEPIAPTGGNKVAITLNVGGGAKAEVDPPHVNFEAGDQILVASNGHYVGTLTASKSGEDITFSGDITDPVEGEPLYFYFLGNKDTGTLTPGTSGSTSCTVDISDQTNYPHLPVISMGVSIDRSNHNAIVEYSSGVTSYEAQLHNKASLIKFNVTTPSNSPICITGMNNQVTVKFNDRSVNDGFSYGKADANGVIKMAGVASSGDETWAIVLQQNELAIGAEGSAYTEDGIYVGARAAVPAITMNQFIDTDRPMTVNTVTPLGTPLTFEAKVAGAKVKFKKYNDETLEYSYNGGDWTTYTDNTDMTLTNAGDKISFRGDNSTQFSKCEFTLTGACYVYGNVMSLIHEDASGFSTATTLPCEETFKYLFDDNADLYSHPDKVLILPATTLTQSCYVSMFSDCENLERAPELPATVLASNCYYNMFKNCTSLTAGPSILPAETMPEDCCYNMFSGCTSLTIAPSLPATILGENCYQSMFEGCTSLTTVPVLAPITLDEDCCYQMFSGCTSLNNIPAALPATTLAEACYREMFSGCTSLTTAPELSAATTLAESCYREMFSGCTSLNNIPAVLPVTTLAESCYREMFSGCTSLTTAPELPAATLVNSCYEGMFYNCSNLNSVTCYATSELDNTDDWLSGVAATGTLNVSGGTKSAWEATSTVPTGWTIVDPSAPVIEPNEVTINLLGDLVLQSEPGEGVASTTINGITLSLCEGEVPGQLSYGNLSGSSLTFSAARNIVSIVIEITWQETQINGWNVDESNWVKNEDDDILTWTGNASSVTLGDCNEEMEITNMKSITITLAD